MSSDSYQDPYERILQDSLQDTVRVLSAYLPCESKPLSALLQEEQPQLRCKDGSNHLFKKKELNYLKSLISDDELEVLSLPIFIEVVSENEMLVLCPTEVEEKVISKVLDMPVVSRDKKIFIYRPQLNLLRKRLKTTTQYIFHSTSP